MKNFKRYQLLVLWVGAALVTSCGPKLYEMDQRDFSSEDGRLKTVCNQIDLSNLGFLQIHSPYASSSYLHVRFSQNPIPNEGDELIFGKWSEKDLTERSYAASYRASYIHDGWELPLTAEYFDSGVLTSDVVEDFMKIIASRGFSTSGNVFSKIQFTVRGLEESEWSGLSVHLIDRNHSGLLPPFELQYEAYKERASQLLWGFHPLYEQAPKTRAQLEELKSSYCSLFD